MAGPIWCAGSPRVLFLSQPETAGRPVPVAGPKVPQQRTSSAGHVARPAADARRASPRPEPALGAFRI
ncbi:hypothetical protein NOCARDAX2BIS_460106 [Nocardioides sp. AX2bis]|nr:hypothetical protein NOCARDAX2BIS_460106 [Nocardioides sp. AX2bis]